MSKRSSDLNKLSQDLKDWVKAARREVNTEYRLAILDTLQKIVEGSPQFTGNLASNWRVSLAGAGNVYRPLPEVESLYSPGGWNNPYKRGDDPAVGDALEDAEYVVSELDVRKSVVIYNLTPYAEEVDRGEGPPGKDGKPLSIRPENLVAGEVQMLAFAYARAQSKGWRQ